MGAELSLSWSPQENALATDSSLENLRMVEKGRRTRTSWSELSPAVVEGLLGVLRLLPSEDVVSSQASGGCDCGYWDAGRMRRGRGRGELGTQAAIWHTQRWERTDFQTIANTIACGGV